MTEAPKEIWATLDHWVGPGGYWDTSPNADSDPPDVKYIREDESKALEEAAYKRGLEEAAKIAEETATCLLPSGHFLSERVAAAIRAKIDDA